MNDAAEEERLLRAITRKPPTIVPKGTTPRPPDVTPTVKVVSPRGNAYAEQLELLHSKKSAVAGSTVATRRELDEVHLEIERLKAREAELVVMLEKREAATKRLNEEIESVERAAKGQTEDLKKKTEEDKVRRAREEEKKQIEADESKRRSSNPSTSPPASPQKSGGISPRVENIPQSSLPTFQARASSVRTVAPPDSSQDGLTAEEARLIRAMNRKSLVPGAPTRAQTVKLPEPKSREPVHEPAWKEQERAREAERAARLAEENRKKEGERRATLDREAEAKRAEENRVTAMQSREGVLHTFTSPTIYDFDAEVKICGDFTDYREVPLTAPLNDNFTYSITFPLTPGHHFYRFKIDTKWELNKNQLTGVAPTGDVMNKIEI